MSIVKLSAGLCIGGSILLSSYIQAEQFHLPILQYHHVGEETPFSTSVTPAQFREHLEFLENDGYQVIDLSSGIKKLRNGEGLPDKAVAITFDDAYKNIYEKGFPILKEKSFPFTVFINTDPVLHKNRNFLTWDEMREMQQYGAVMANHTMSHPYMMRHNEEESFSAWFARIKQEVLEVESLLVETLGSSPKMLAYPYGESNELIRSFLEELDIVGFGQQSGVVSSDSDFSNLPRFPASGAYAKLSTLKTKLSSVPMPLTKVDTGGDFAGEEPVSMTLSFKEGQYRTKEFTCYVSGQGKADINWLTEQKVSITAKKAFSYGRGRINCTMPVKKSTNYHWFSNVWVKPRAEEGYVVEKSEKY
ncbi:polysaccharide deacetylase family protein [Marinomonas sp. 15G1-11]|uniref:Polysaccharide deacetylase family protein n=1 Tax=Marinomonas phaeophyticola TaxID=3004091 RepID=A0ABT4JUR8_9GAMM|nr:polysaccharide deacetylase family protein [Marinomonas sp. 15G1-11]MCZ2722142.1 polysaccharide deacetylase family protein [Marinomonas sp. 15G1-11]